MATRETPGAAARRERTDSSSEAPESYNRLLAAMSADDLAELTPHMERVEVAVHQMLAKQGETFTHVWFPTTCVISLVTRMTDGAGVEVGTIGNEGVAGMPAYLEADASESDTFCQIPGQAIRMPVRALIDAAAERPAVRLLMNRYLQAYVILVAQSAACNRLHDIEQRCARWLLMTHDRVEFAETFPLKHEFLALMLGVRRAGVTIAAGALQDRGLIRYTRGAIRITDRAGLEASACECYGVVRRRFEKLLA